MATTTELSVSSSGFFRLLAWTSPSYPVGAFSYSHGIEFAVEDGLVTDRDSFVRWAEGIIRFGTGKLDAEFFRAAWGAVSEDNQNALLEVAQWAAAMRGTSELALESSATGDAFLQILRKTTDQPLFAELVDGIVEDGTELAYPVVVAIAAATEKIPLEAALAAFLHAFVSNLVSAAVRLVPLGQTDGQIALLALETPVLDIVAETMSRKGQAFDPEFTGTSTVMVDWSSMQHETQYTRLFRS